MSDLIAGHVPVYFGNFAEILPHAKGDKVKVIALSGAQRSPQFSNVQTVAEQGFPGFQANTWNGIAVPSGTPSAVVERIAREIAAAAKDAAFVKRLEGVGAYPVGNTPEQFAKALKSDYEVWGDAVRSSGAKLE